MVHKVIEQTINEIKALAMPDIILTGRSWSSSLYLSETVFDTSIISNDIVRNLLNLNNNSSLCLNSKTRTLEHSLDIKQPYDLEELLRREMIDAIGHYGNKNWSKRYKNTILHRWLKIEMLDFEKALEVFQFVCGDDWNNNLDFDIADQPRKYTHKEKHKFLKKIMKRKQK